MIRRGFWVQGVRIRSFLVKACRPHLRLEETRVSIPIVEPGDATWWPPDMSFLIFLTAL